jgi:acetyltransferase-like isoleucine patch superfamily enzyme
VGEKVKLGSGVTTMNKLESVTSQEATKIIKGRVYKKLGTIIGPNATIGSNVVMMPGVMIDADQVIFPGMVVREDIL